MSGTDSKKLDPLHGATIVFDLDGTLVDSAPDLLRALNQVLDLDGLPHPPAATVHKLVGHGARRLIERATTLCGAHYTETRLDQLTEAFIDFYARDIASLSRPYPGVVAVLDEFAAAGAILAVCTNKRTDLSVQLLEALGLAERFAVIVGADAVAARKPDPGHVLETVSRAGGAKERALMIGDTEADAAAAKAAEVPVVLVRFGYGDAEAVAASIGADALIESYEELPALARTLLIR
jgi:phosphoglycolate phosphatase